MIGDVFSRIGSASLVLWQSMIKVLRKLMDFIASKNVLIEDYIMSRFYTSLLHCLHLVLADPKGPLSEHVAGLVASLQLFFTYGVSNRSAYVFGTSDSKDKEVDSPIMKSRLVEPTRSDCGRYRPPHLRKREGNGVHVPKFWGSESSVRHEPSGFGSASSDSEQSDGDGFVKDMDRFRSSKARIAALICIQDLCQADPKSLIALWTMLLPTNDVLKPRKYQENLMTCLLFDPILKTRIASASTLALMLDGRSSLFLQVAEYKESTKCGSFTTLSSSLGQILMQLHTGFVRTQGKPALLSTMFQYSQQGTHPTIRFEALQVLKAVSHNYPHLITECWEHISAAVLEQLKVSNYNGSSYEVSARTWKGDSGNNLAANSDKCTVAAIKVLDEALRAASGFRGTEEFLDDRLLDIKLLSGCTKDKKISSAPSYGFDGPHNTGETDGSKQWSEALSKHLSFMLSHKSSTVRAATVTCFAGITSLVFFALSKEMQDFIISSSITASSNDEVSSVRSAACRALGVLACFPGIFRSVQILNKFVHAAEFNTHDPLLSVRITASWALANMCDSLRHQAIDLDIEKSSTGSMSDSESVMLLAESALRLTKDSDKVKANAVRALGNLSRFVRFSHISTPYNEIMSNVGPYLLQTSVEPKAGSQPFSSNVSKTIPIGDSNWLEKMVQAFVSCVTTGNVKELHFKRNSKNTQWIWSVDDHLLAWPLSKIKPKGKYKLGPLTAAVVLGATKDYIIDYGGSFPDVIQGLEHVLETLCSDQSLPPSSLKNKVTLEKQLAPTTLHVLSLASPSEPQPLKDFLVKKSSFLEEWIKSLCISSLEVPCDQPTEAAFTSAEEGHIDDSETSLQKKAMISKAIRSLVEIYEGNNNHTIARRFQNLLNMLQ
ncbi:hypothetical protein QJS04_geneDACA013201 [Acorus gramineus]|uniref:DUF4042 domain-containing protein n=1 Tax=Acorus gramineus TaxID=55184 RepID=A0AAV9BA34_ACOGR|nr:hypothetical protein QJS04_geneDACA013201 [Acorus gramineus]